MRKILLIALLTICGLAPSGAELTETQKTRLRKVLHDATEKGDVAGGALLLIHKSETVFREGFGWADSRRKI